MDTNMPVLFLDIDGTASPMWRGDDTTNFSSVDCRFPNVMFDPKAIATIARWVTDGLVEVRWLTDWEDDAQSFGAAVGLPVFRAYRMSEAVQDPRAPERDWYKEQIVRQFCATTNRRYVWADDNADDSGNEHEANADQALERDYPGRGIVISPDTNFGLRQTDMELIEQFLTTEG